MNLEAKARTLRTRYRSLQKRAATAAGFKKVVSECVSRAAAEGPARDDLNLASRFAATKFAGKFRQDKRTPLFLHSLFLIEILSSFGIHDPGTLLAALLHDTIEDTDTRRREIKDLRLESTNKKVLPLVLKLTQDRKVSDLLPKDSAISPRVRKFIKNLTGAPKEVLNIELADRIHDFLDVGYLKTLDPEKGRLRLANKIKRNGTIVYTITRNRKDISGPLLSFFRFLEREIRKELRKL